MCLYASSHGKNNRNQCGGKNMYKKCCKKTLNCLYSKEVIKGFKMIYIIQITTFLLKWFIIIPAFIICKKGVFKYYIFLTHSPQRALSSTMDRELTRGSMTR